MKPTTPVRSISCPNPACGREHGLFWYIPANGKRQLMYRCDRVEQQGAAKHTGNAIIVSHTESIEAPAGAVPDKGLPEVYTRGAAEKENNKQQYQLPLMK